MPEKNFIEKIWKCLSIVTFSAYRAGNFETFGEQVSIGLSKQLSTCPAKQYKNWADRNFQVNY